MRLRRASGLTSAVVSGGMGGVKTALLLAVLAVFTLASCSTLSNRRDLFGPGSPDGKYTSMLKHNTVLVSGARASHGNPK